MEHLVDIFRSTCSRFPDRIALKDCNGSYTYQEVYSRSLRIGEFLKQNHIQPGDRVVCITKKNNDSLLCFWGTLLSGAVAVLLDHEDTVKSNVAKLKQAGAKAVIYDKTQGGTIPGIDPDIMQLDFPEILSANPRKRAGAGKNEMDHPEICYILFTSGTLGIPKAVQISQTNIVHYTSSIYERLGCPAQVRAAHVSTFAADLGLTGLLVALRSGGMLRIFNKEESTDPARFNAVMHEDKISLLKITPSHFSSLISHIARPFKQPIEYLILGGEKLQWTVVKHIFNAGACSQLYNHYGPTETTVGAMVYKVDKNSVHFDVTASVPIGKPLGRGSGFINMETDKPAGELYIAGPGVSPGYLNNPSDTTKRFLTGDQSCYKTGDICQLLDDGNFEFLYRSDRQVKIRGYRIELGEVELALASHPDVESATVIASTVNDHSILEAFIKPVEGKDLKEKNLRAWLMESLPAFKIPSAMYFYSSAPLNANGKMDLDGLLRFFKDRTSENAGTLNSAGTWSLAVNDCWKSILNKARVSPKDHFFETGGDSLLAIQLVGKLQRLGYRININHLNSHPVFSDFASLSPEKLADPKAPAPDALQQRHTVSQELFLKQQEFNADHYCQSILLETSGPVSIREMALALNHVLTGHPQLSSAFGDGREIKTRASVTALGAIVLDGREPVSTQIQSITGRLLKEISLEKGRLLAAQVFIDPSGKDYLYLACHHIAVDVISWNIIIDELRDYYNQLLQGLVPEPVAEDAVNDFVRPAAIPETEIAGLTRISEPLWNLPASADEVAIPGSSQVHSLILPADISGLLQRQDELKNTQTVAGFLLSALGSSVLTEFGLPAISIDVEFHGRPQHAALPDLSRSVSWWALTLPLNIERERSGAEHCSQLLKFKSEDAGRMNLTHTCQVRRREQRPDLRFNYLGHFPEQFGSSGFRLRPSAINPGAMRSKKAQQEYDLFFTARFIGASLIVDIQYSTSRFSEANIAGLANNFFNSLKQSLLKEKAHEHTSQIISLKSHVPSVGQPLYRLDVGAAREHNQAKTFLLTGATGFLGAHLLKEMIGDERATVYCLVRAETREIAEMRLAGTVREYFGDLPATALSRIIAVKGDLRAASLGLDPSDYQDLSDHVDVIIHAAADINLARSYKELYQTNVGAVAEIIKLARKGKRKELHYVSTLAIAGYNVSGRHCVFSEKDFDQGQQFISDYERTKFEAEKLVREFYAGEGRGKIYRVGHVAAHSVTSRFQKNMDENRIFQVIKGILLLQQVPESYNEPVSFSYVDVVAAGIVNACRGNYPEEINCMHLENPHSLSFAQVISMLNLMSYNIRTVSMDVFRRSVREYEGQPEDKRAIDIMSMWVQRFMDTPRNIKFTSAHSVDLLARSGLYFPMTSLAWLKNVISEGVKMRYLHAHEISEKSMVFDSD